MTMDATAMTGGELDDVDHLAVWLESFTDRTHPAQDAAAMLRRLRALVGELEAERDAIARNASQAQQELTAVRRDRANWRAQAKGQSRQAAKLEAALTASQADAERLAAQLQDAQADALENGRDMICHWTWDAREALAQHRALVAAQKDRTHDR